MASYHRINPLPVHFTPPRKGTWSPRQETGVPVGPDQHPATARAFTPDHFGGAINHRSKK